MILRASKFFGYCYGDSISEKEFFAKNFKAEIVNELLQLSFVFAKGLDSQIIKDEFERFTFIEIEDVYLKNKLINFLNDFPQVKKLQLLKGDSFYTVKRLKLTHKGFVIQLV